MSNRPFVNITAATAAEVCARFIPKKEAFALLRDGMAPGEFVEALVAGKQYLPGVPLGRKSSRPDFKVRRHESNQSLV